LVVGYLFKNITQEESNLIENFGLSAKLALQTFIYFNYKINPSSLKTKIKIENYQKYIWILLTSTICLFFLYEKKIHGMNLIDANFKTSILIIIYFIITIFLYEMATRFINNETGNLKKFNYLVIIEMMVIGMICYNLDLRGFKFERPFYSFWVYYKLTSTVIYLSFFYHYKNNNLVWKEWIYYFYNLLYFNIYFVLVFPFFGFLNFDLFDCVLTTFVFSFNICLFFCFSRLLD
jgi:hypothetical protein